MGHLKSLRIAFAICLLTSCSFLIFKMFHKLDTVKSLQAIPDRMKVKQFQRFTDTRTTTSRKVASKVQNLTTVRVDNPATAARSRGSVSSAASMPRPVKKTQAYNYVPTKTKSTQFHRRSQNGVETVPLLPFSNKTSQHDFTNITDLVKSQLADKKTKTFPVPSGDEFNEHDFVTNVELTLRKSPANPTYGEALKDVISRVKSRTSEWERNEKNSLLDSQFLHYMKCPTSVRKKILLATSHIRRKLVLETPILAWNKHYTHDEYARLARFHGIFGWQDSKEADIASALSQLSSPHNRYLFDHRLVNGKIPNDGKCIRCAVVGNGGILNGSKQGKEIDGNDYIFRVNTALTRGYEEDVGTRTSFYCFGMITLSNTLAGGYKTHFTEPPNDEGIRYVFFADSHLTYTYLTSQLSSEKETVVQRRRAVRFPKKLHAEDIKLVHPDFERYLKWSWVNSTNQHNAIHRPTTGGIMLLLALHTCDEVNAYGFGGSFRKFSEHYYDKTFVKHVNYGNHDNAAENRLWKQLNDLEIINLYTRE